MKLQQTIYTQISELILEILIKMKSRRRKVYVRASSRYRKESNSFGDDFYKKNNKERILGK